MNHRILFLIAMVEFCVFIFSGVSFTAISANPYFDLNVDPLRWGFFILRLPQSVLSHWWLAVFLDVTILCLFILILLKPQNRWLALSLLILLLFFYSTLTGYLTHRNYQAGFCLIFLPFIFSGPTSKIYAFEAVRYFILFFYFSAAFLKISSGALFDPYHFSKALQGQFLPYFLESNTGWRTQLNQYLVSHARVAFSLYLGAFLVEFIMIAGFFTKRIDALLACLLLIFHLFNWIVMDIAPWGQIAVICMLSLSKSFDAKSEGTRKGETRLSNSTLFRCKRSKN